MEDSQRTPDGGHDLHAFLMEQVSRNARIASRAHKAADKAKRDGSYAIKRGRVTHKSH